MSDFPFSIPRRSDATAGDANAVTGVSYSGTTLSLARATGADLTTTIATDDVVNGVYYAGDTLTLTRAEGSDLTTTIATGDPTKIENGTSKMEIASDGACVFTPNGSANTTTFATDGNISTKGDVIIPQVYARNAPSNKLLFKDNAGNTPFGDAGINFVGGPLGNENNGSHLNFFTNDTSRLNITRDGKVGINGKLDVGGTTISNSDNAILFLQSPYNSPTFIKSCAGPNWTAGQHEIEFYHYVGSNAARNKMKFKLHSGTTDATPSDVLTLIGNGKAEVLDTVTAADVLLTSDDRIKENEKLIVNATETLSKLTPQIYDKYQTMDLSGSFRVESGLIAQEVYYNAPELRHLVEVGNEYDASGNEYTPTPDEMDLSGVDIANDPDYGNHGWSKTEHSSLSYTGFIPYLIKSNQELAERLAALENK